MIKTIEIENFQSHKHTVMDFSPGINVVIGESDAGKSAFHRSLYWLFQNRPRGDGFRNWDCKVNERTRVAAEFGNSEWIAREKGKGINVYQTSLIEDDLEALRTDVPKEIFDTSKMDDINLQKQKTWFLLDEKPGAVAKKFNTLADLEVMDNALQIVNADVRDIKSKNKILTESKAEKEEELTSLNMWLEPATKEFKSISDLYAEIKELVNKETVLADTLHKIITIDESLVKFKFNKEVSATIGSLEKSISEINTLEEKRRTLKELTESIGTVTSKISAYADMRFANNDVTELLLSLNEIDDLIKEKKNLAVLITGAKSITEQCGEHRNFVVKTQKVFDGLMKELGACPFCGGKVK
jgi:DNA repair protein SbcC/Rad50